jgi:hypothetical protein
MAALLQIDFSCSYGLDSDRPFGGTFFRGFRVEYIPVSFKDWFDEVAAVLTEGWFGIRADNKLRVVYGSSESNL